MKRRPRLPILLAVLLVVGAAAARGAGEAVSAVFQQANAAYEAKRFEDAIALYESLVREHGVVNGYLFYNLGNAYFRSGDLGRAILNYRRAQRLVPRFSDLARNLDASLAVLATDETAKREEPGDLWEYLNQVRRRYTLNETLGAFLVCYLAFTLALVVRLWGRERGWVHVLFPYVFWLSLAGCAVLGVAAAGTIHEQRVVRQAVVVAVEAPLRTGPGGNEDYPVRHKLAAGETVRLLEVHRAAGSRRQYAKVQAPNGLQGWTERENVEAVDWRSGDGAAGGPVGPTHERENATGDETKEGGL